MFVKYYFTFIVNFFMKASIRRSVPKRKKTSTRQKRVLVEESDQRLLNWGACLAALRPYSIALLPETFVFTWFSWFGIFGSLTC